MNVTPDQLRAARAMLGLNQSDLAKLANKSLPTITEAERYDPARLPDPADIQDIRHVLEQSGVQFIPWGVRKPPPLTAEQQALYDELRAISLQSAAELKDHDRLTDDDLYDENGLPA